MYIYMCGLVLMLVEIRSGESVSNIHGRTVEKWKRVVDIIVVVVDLYYIFDTTIEVGGKLCDGLYLFSADFVGMYWRKQ